MYKHILVPLSGGKLDEPLFEAAVKVARLAAGHLTFLHVRVDVADTLMAMSAGGMGGGPAVQEVLDRLEAEVKAAETRVWEAFGAFCAKEGIGTDRGTGEVSAELVVETGQEAGWVAEHGRFADLLVLARGTAEGQGTGSETVEAALMDTGRPVLLVPDKALGEMPGLVLIAWKDTPEAARAVADAMPLIDKASEVVIVSVEEAGATRADAAERLQRSLRWHNLATRVRYLPREGRAPVDVLFSEAQALGAGVVVMGGYSHSRLREVVFGGFTQKVLGGADLPVLIAH